MAKLKKPKLWPEFADKIFRNLKNMIVLFDCNSYDKLINLSRNDLQKIRDRVEKIIMPQVVREQLNMMIERPDKIEKLSKINQIIAEFDIAGKLSYIPTCDANQIYFNSLPDKMKTAIKKSHSPQKKREQWWLQMTRIS